MDVAARAPPFGSERPCGRHWTDRDYAELNTIVQGLRLLVSREPAFQLVLDVHHGTNESLRRPQGSRGTTSVHQADHRAVIVYDSSTGVASSRERRAALSLDDHGVVKPAEPVGVVCPHNNPDLSDPARRRLSRAADLVDHVPYVAGPLVAGGANARTGRYAWDQSCWSTSSARAASIVFGVMEPCA